MAPHSVRAVPREWLVALGAYVRAEGQSRAWLAGAATTMTLRAEELTTVPGTFGEPTRVVASKLCTMPMSWSMYSVQSMREPLICRIVASRCS